MRRVKFACLQQTMHFTLRDTLSPDDTERICRAEYDQYRLDLERKHIAYKIDEETIQPDGSIIIRIKKQYNAHDTGDYLE